MLSLDLVTLQNLPKTFAQYCKQIASLLTNCFIIQIIQILCSKLKHTVKFHEAGNNEDIFLVLRDSDLQIIRSFSDFCIDAFTESSEKHYIVVWDAVSHQN